MTDQLTKAERSDRMRSVRQIGTSLELLVRRELHKRGLRFRLGGCGLPGRPDLVFPRLNAVLFVHGCFWHAHHCRMGRRPKTNRVFWQQKAVANEQRDARKAAELKVCGWRVFLIWQCELTGDGVDQRLDLLARVLKQSA